MTVKFPADIYAAHRPLYPQELFATVGDWVKQAGLTPPLTVADIGSGAGHSLIGLSQCDFVSELVAIEPDEEMIEKAKRLTRYSSVPVEFIEATGERTTLQPESIDLILCANSFHWMKRAEAAAEFLRVNRKGGLICLAEYRFPKSVESERFNAWISERTSGDWQHPERQQETSFTDMVSVFSREPGITELGVQTVPMYQEMPWNEVAGLIRSHSGYAYYRTSLDDEDDRAALDAEMEESIRRILGDEPTRFDFLLQLAGFKT